MVTSSGPGQPAGAPGERGGIRIRLITPRLRGARLAEELVVIGVVARQLDSPLQNAHAQLLRAGCLHLGPAGDADGLEWPSAAGRGRADHRMRRSL